MPPHGSASSLVAGPLTEPSVSVDDVAGHLSMRKGSICRWIEHGGLPAKKIGRLWKLSEVDAWARARGAGDESHFDGSLNLNQLASAIEPLLGDP